MPGLKSPDNKTELRAKWAHDFKEYIVGLDAGRDDTLALTTGAGTAVLMKASSGDILWRAEGHGGGALALGLSPSSPVLAVGGHDGRVHLYDTRSGALLRALTAGTGWVEHLAWSADGGRLAASVGRVAHVWTAAGEPLFSTEAHPSTITGLTWSRKGSRIATSCYGGVHLWPLKADIQAQHLAWKGSLIRLAWSPDEKVIACASQDGSVHFWRLPSGRDSEMSGYRFKPRALAWDSASSLLATGGDADICVWDFSGKGPEGARPWMLEGHQALCTELAFSPTPRGLLASGAQESGILLWEPRRARRPTGFTFLEDEVTALRWSPRGDALFGADARGTVKRLALP